MALNFPSTPVDGDVYEAEGAVYTWVAAENVWQKGNTSTSSVTIVEADAVAGWQVWGDTLIQWGRHIGSDTSTAITFPHMFKSDPKVTTGLNNGATESPTNTSFSVQTWGITTAQFFARAMYNNGTNVGVSGADVNWVAVGEATDDMKQPKNVFGGGNGDEFVQKAGDTMTGMLSMQRTSDEQIRLGGAIDDPYMSFYNISDTRAGYVQVQGDGHAVFASDLFGIQLRMDDSGLTGNDGRINGLDASLPYDGSLVTRERGDARYAQLDAENTFNGSQTITQAGDTVLFIKATPSAAGADDDAFLILSRAETGEAEIGFRKHGSTANEAVINYYDSAGTDTDTELNITNYNGKVDLQAGSALARFYESGNLYLTGANATTDTRQFRVESDGYAQIRINGDHTNASGEPGGAAVTFHVDGTGANGIVSYVQQANTDGLGNAYTYTTSNSMLIGTYSGNLFLGNDDQARFMVGTGTFRPTVDNSRDLGSTSFRFDDVYATNGNINTSDAKEKQDVEELNEAERRVAVAVKGLLRKYRWIADVEEKGDAARIHFGIIAQDLQAAFAAEGLDAGRYGMFIESTWWEADVVLPAIEEVKAEFDDRGTEIVAPRRAAPERTQTQTYEAGEQAPKNATQRTRLGVRYPELLAFIIAAL